MSDPEHAVPTPPSPYDRPEAGQPQAGEHTGSNGVRPGEAEHRSLNGHGRSQTAPEGADDTALQAQVNELRRSLYERDRQIAELQSGIVAQNAAHDAALEQYRRRELRVGASMKATAELRRRMAEQQVERDVLERQGREALAELRNGVMTERETWRVTFDGLNAELAKTRAELAELRAGSTAKLVRLQEMAAVLRASTSLENQRLQIELEHALQQIADYEEVKLELERVESLYKAAVDMFMTETDAAAESVRREAGEIDMAIRAIHNSRAWRLKAAVGGVVNRVRLRRARRSS